MLRKGASVSNIIGISSTSSSSPTTGTSNAASSGTSGLTSSSVTSSPSHHHYPHHRSHYRSSSSQGRGGDRESFAHHLQHQRSSQQQQFYHRSTPPSSSATLEVGTSSSTLPKRGSSQSTSDISSAIGIGSKSRSPSRHSHSHHQDHCCGCAQYNNSGNSSANLAPLKGATATDGIALISGNATNSLRRQIVTSSIPRSPRAGSPQLTLCALSSPSYHQPLHHATNRDCPVDSHPRLTTNLNHRSSSGEKIWLVGKGDEDGDNVYCEIEEDDDDERRDPRAVTTHHLRRVVGVNSVNTSPPSATAAGGGSASHGYSQHHLLQQHTTTTAHNSNNPSPVIVTATVPYQGGGPPGLSSAQYNAGPTTTSTPINNPPGFNNHLFKLQNSSSSTTPSVVATPPELLLPMDFIQVLIHQHAKTIVALQDLQREVSTLKDFRTSLLHSLPATGAPTAPGSNGLSEAVWTTGGAGAVGGTSAPAAGNSSSSSTGAGATTTTPKIPHPDSGFSTETKSTNQKSDAESDDELYSLLSLIQCKVQESIIRNDYLLSSHQNKSAVTTTGSSAGRSGRKSDSSRPKERLGKLDKVLGNCDKVEFRKDFISRDVIRGVLGAEKTELQRQLFFALVKIENLKSLTKEQKTIDSRVHALSQENEQLRYKLKEMEIELEGTKANLRILQKSSFPPSPLHLGSKSSVTCAAATTTVLPEASCHSPSTISNHPPHSSRLVVPPVVAPTLMWETDSLDNTDPADFAIPGATTPAVVTSTPAVVASSNNAPVSSASTTTRQRLIQKLTDIESVNNSSSPLVAAAANNNSTIRLSANNNYSYGSSSSNHHNHSSSSKKSPAPKPPVILEQATPVSPPSSNNNNNNPMSKQQQKSASPVGNKSMSSIKSNNSSIPIAVSRLKKKDSIGTSVNHITNTSTSKLTPTGKLKSGTSSGNGSGGPGANNENGGTFWANWFTRS